MTREKEILLKMAKQALSAEAEQGGRYENAMQKLREMPRYLNGVKEKQIKKISADAVQGEWIKKQVFNPELDKYVPMIECSVCGYEPYFGGSESKFNYCANCGTRMKGGDDE